MANQPKSPIPQTERELSRKEGNALSRLTTEPHPEDKLTGLIPMEGETLAGAYDTARLLEEAEQVRLAKAATQTEKEQEHYQYFVKCRRPHPPGYPSHGIYLTRNPKTGEVKPDEWLARYRAKDAAGKPMPWYEQIVCQVCLWQYGERVPLDIRMTSQGCFTVAPRWLWRRPKDVKRAQIEGETRAEEGPYSGANVGRTEAVERAAKAGFEVV